MHPENIYDKERVSFNLIRYQKYGKNFELAVEPDLAIAYKNSKNKTDEALREMLRAEKIFSDTKKGLLADENEFINVFGTKDFIKIAKKMVEEGEIQLTSDFREKMRAEKRKNIIQTIHRICIDPRTNLPHPQLRIENAMEEAKVKIDENKKAEDQVQDIISKLKPIIPIKVDEKEITLTMPLNVGSKIKGVLAGYGVIEHEEWLKDQYICRMKVPAGIYADLVDELNARTHGSVDIRDEKPNGKKIMY